MALSIALPPQMEALARALVKMGYYGNVSEVGRAALDQFIRAQPPQRKLQLAMHLYRQGEATLARVAEIADVSLREARALLKESGLLRQGREASQTERTARVKAAAARYP